MPGARYVDLSGQIPDGVVQERIRMFVEAAAIIIRDEIVAIMEESDPSGRHYEIPNTNVTYQASAPGEPPAIRTGAYRSSWAFTPAVVDGQTVVAGVVNTRRTQNDDPLWFVLEFGSADRNLEPRPHIQPAIDRAKPKIRQLARQMGGGR